MSDWVKAFFLLIAVIIAWFITFGSWGWLIQSIISDHF